MLIIIPLTIGVMAVLVGLSLFLLNGVGVKLTDQKGMVLDPLSLGVVGPTNSARVKLRMLSDDGRLETLPLIVCKATRLLYLRYGLKYFMNSFIEMSIRTDAKCLVGDSWETAQQMNLSQLSEKLFAENDVQETVELMHDLTEADFEDLEKGDADATRYYLKNFGFESCSA